MPRFRFTRTQTIYRVYEIEAETLDQAAARIGEPAKVVSERIFPEVSDRSTLTAEVESANQDLDPLEGEIALLSKLVDLNSRQLAELKGRLLRLLPANG